MAYSDTMKPADLRATRERLGLTQAELAEHLSTPDHAVSKQTVWFWEQPEGSPHRRNPPPYLGRAMRDLERELGRRQE